MQVSYTPGGWTLLSRSDRYVLVDAPLADPAVARLWNTLALAPDLNTVLTSLGEDLPGSGFCLLELREDEILIAQVGAAAELDGAPLPVSGEIAPARFPVRGGTLTVSVEGTDPSLRIPFEAGVVTAGGLALEYAGDPEAPEPEPEPEPQPAPEPEPVPEPAPAPESGPEPVPTSVVVGPTVLAGRCPNGHLSGAFSPGCRVCGAPMPEQEPQTVPRPVLGELVLANGETVVLSRGTVLGRAPRPQDPDGEEPNLVNLAAYGRDVSRQHLEIVLRGWNVLVRDLGSANGTVLVSSAGRTLLPPSTLVPLAAGDVLEIAEVTAVRFDVTA